MENSVAVHSDPAASMDVCARAKTPRLQAPGLRWKARELTQLEKPTNSISTQVNSYVASLPQIATCPGAFQVR